MRCSISGGPDALSQLEVIAVYEELAGKTFERTQVQAAELERRYHEASGPTERSLAGVMLGVAHGGVTEMRKLVAECGIRLTGVRELAVRQLA